MPAQVVANLRNGNGHYPLPNSRRAFLRSAPPRLGALEDEVETLKDRIAALARPAVVEIRVDNLVEIVDRLTRQVRRIDKRSSRSRRRLIAISSSK